MGLLRILLAICVFCSHTRPLGNLPWLNGEIAVEIFFVISGFYMQLVLTNRYTENALGKMWILNFYMARYFKLFPIYIGAAVLAVGVAILTPSLAPVSIWKFIWELPDTINNVFFKVFIVFTNFTIFFQDIMHFFAVHGDEIEWSANFKESTVALWQGLAVPQAWSLGIELSFYIMAPYLLNLRSRWLIIGSCLGLITKIIVVSSFNLSDPWTYRFFPFELCYFLFGALAYRYRSRLDGLVHGHSGIYVVYTIVIFICVFKLPIYPRYVWYPLAAAFILPFVFRMTSNIKVDRLIGELSYPFYIFHIFSVHSATFAVLDWFHWDERWVAWAGLGLTFALSAAALALETYFIEPSRARLAERRILGKATKAGQTIEGTLQ